MMYLHKFNFSKLYLIKALPPKRKANKIFMAIRFYFNLHPFLKYLDGWISLLSVIRIKTVTHKETQLTKAPNHYYTNKRS